MLQATKFWGLESLCMRLVPSSVSIMHKVLLWQWLPISDMRTIVHFTLVSTILSPSHLILKEFTQNLEGQSTYNPHFLKGGVGGMLPDPLDEALSPQPLPIALNETLLWSTLYVCMGNLHVQITVSPLVGSLLNL